MVIWLYNDSQIRFMSTLPPLTQMMETLVSIPSVSSAQEHLDTSNIEVVHTLANWLDEFNFRTEIQRLPGNPNKANLIATLGEGDDGLVLSGHTDTVPYDEHSWRQDPFKLTQHDDRLCGLGSTDMKSFFALVVEALRSVSLNKLNKPLVILATADEESTMDGAKYLLEQQRALGKYCVIGEPTELKPIRQHKGIFMESVSLRGKSGHSSDPDAGNNALEGMHEVIAMLVGYRKQLAERYNNADFIVPIPTLNLGHIHGGDNANRICGDCELHYDLRLLPGMDLGSIRQTLRDNILEIAQRRNLECSLASLFDGVPALSTNEQSHIVKVAEEITGNKSASVVFGTEGPYMTQLGMETIILGAGSIRVAHQANEYIEIAQLQPAIDTYANIIKEICLGR